MINELSYSNIFSVVSAAFRCLYVFLSIRLSVCIPFFITIFLSFCLSFFYPVCPSFYLSLFLYLLISAAAYLHIYALYPSPYANLHMCPSISLSLFPALCLSYRALDHFIKTLPLPLSFFILPFPSFLPFLLPLSFFYFFFFSLFFSTFLHVAGGRLKDDGKLWLPSSGMEANVERKGREFTLFKFRRFISHDFYKFINLLIYQ